jgi:hypothetical protein
MGIRKVDIHLYKNEIRALLILCTKIIQMSKRLKCKEEDVRKGCRKVNVVEILCTHACR